MTTFLNVNSNVQISGLGSFAKGTYVITLNPSGSITIQSGSNVIWKDNWNIIQSIDGALVLNDQDALNRLRTIFAPGNSAIQSDTTANATVRIGNGVTTLIINPVSLVDTKEILMPISPVQNIPLYIQGGGTITSPDPVVTTLTWDGSVTYIGTLPDTLKSGDCIIIENVSTNKYRVISVNS